MTVRERFYTECDCDGWMFGMSEFGMGGYYNGGVCECRIKKIFFFAVQNDDISVDSGGNLWNVHTCTLCFCMPVAAYIILFVFLSCKV